MLREHGARVLSSVSVPALAHCRCLAVCPVIHWVIVLHMHSASRRREQSDDVLSPEQVVGCLWIPWTASPHSMRWKLEPGMVRWTSHIWFGFWASFGVYGQLEVAGRYIEKIPIFFGETGGWGSSMTAFLWRSRAGSAQPGPSLSVTVPTSLCPL